MGSIETPHPSSRAHGAGTLCTGLAFALWGALPVYWKALQQVDSLEIIAHRILWSLAVTAALVTFLGLWRGVAGALRSRRSAGLLLLSSTLLTLNWLTYVWGVNNNQIVETSLGYFITPLVNVALGVIFLRERLRPAQIAAFLLAGGGVIYLIVRQGRFPWIAFALAGTFAFYGLLRKTAALESLPGLTAETAMLTVPAGVFLAALAWRGGGGLGHADTWTHVLLVGTGLVTAVPLLLFAYGARRIRLSTVGILQYLSPTGTFLLGVLVYHEAFDPARVVAFVLIWVALAIYATESLLRPTTRSDIASAAK